MSTDVRHDPDAERFYVELEGGDAELDYHVEDDTADFRSTFVPPEHRGEDIGEEIVVEALQWAREEGLQVQPTCPFVSKVLEDHPEYAGLTAGH